MNPSPSTDELSSPRLLDNRTPEHVIADAHAQFGPFVHRVCLFSGGNDSMVLAHRCRDFYDTLIWVDTGTALPGVAEFVHTAADWLGKPLRVYQPAPDAYRNMVLGEGTKRCTCRGKGCHSCAGTGRLPRTPLGFPGPAQHTRCYNTLKERALETMLADLKREFGNKPRRDRVLALSGIRRSESSRRQFRPDVTKRRALVFCNPISDWHAVDLAAYRKRHQIPQSDVAALLHRSGECNCGAFADPSERHDLQTLFPDWWEQTIAPLEHAAAERGITPAKWGSGRPDSQPIPDTGPMCSDCQLKFDLAPPKAAA